MLLMLMVTKDGKLAPWTGLHVLSKSCQDLMAMIPSEKSFQLLLIRFVILRSLKVYSPLLLSFGRTSCSDTAFSFDSS